MMQINIGQAKAQWERLLRRVERGEEITIDYAKSTLSLDGKSFAFPPLSPAAQELIVAGGAENLVASRLRAKA